MIDREVKQVETCFKRQNLDKYTTLSGYAVKNANKRKNDDVSYQKPSPSTEKTIKDKIARNNKKHQLSRAISQMQSEIRKEKIEQIPELKQFLEEEEQKRKAENERIKQKMKRKGINLDKIYRKTAKTRTALY